jgi:hypothetical protein
MSGEHGNRFISLFSVKSEYVCILSASPSTGWSGRIWQAPEIAHPGTGHSFVSQNRRRVPQETGGYPFNHRFSLLAGMGLDDTP